MSKSSLEAKSMYPANERLNGESLKVFVITEDYYSNPYTIIIVEENEDKAIELFNRASRDSFRAPGGRGFYGLLQSGKLLSIDQTKQGIYVFEAPGNRDLR